MLIFKTVLLCSWLEEDPQGGDLNEPCKEPFLAGSLCVNFQDGCAMLMVRGGRKSVCLLCSCTHGHVNMPARTARTYR